MKKLIIALGIAVSLFAYSSVTLAHVVVKPAQVEPGIYQTFSVGVPVEKQNPTVGLRLVIPQGIQSVSPNVKPGWTIATKKENDLVTEITWTGGSIPSGQRDDFLFSAKVPGTESTIQWKAYQTYQDGTIVAWDKDPNASGDHSGEPYSETKVVAQSETVSPQSVETTSSVGFTLSLVALAFSLIAFATAQKTKRAQK